MVALIEAVPRLTGPVPTRLSEVSAEPVCRLWPAKVSRAARATPPDTRCTQPRVGARGNQVLRMSDTRPARAAWRPRGSRAESCGVGPQVIGVVVGSGAASRGPKSRSPRVVRVTEPREVIGMTSWSYPSLSRARQQRGQAAPLERDPTHPLAQPHAGAAQASTGGRGAHGPAGAVPRAHRRQDPHAPQLLPEEPSSFRLHHNGRGSGFRGAAAPSKAPSVASSISASRAHPSIGYRRASTRFFSCGLSISPADGTVCSGWP